MVCLFRPQSPWRYTREWGTYLKLLNLVWQWLNVVLSLVGSQQSAAQVRGVLLYVAVVMVLCLNLVRLNRALVATAFLFSMAPMVTEPPLSRW